MIIMVTSIKDRLMVSSDTLKILKDASPPNREELNKAYDRINKVFSHPQIGSITHRK